jgi:hypothetical protein
MDQVWMPIGVFAMIVGIVVLAISEYSRKGRNDARAFIAQWGARSEHALRNKEVGMFRMRGARATIFPGASADLYWSGDALMIIPVQAFLLLTVHHAPIIICEGDEPDAQDREPSGGA